MRADAVGAMPCIGLAWLLAASQGQAAPFVVSSPDTAETIELKVESDFRERTRREILVLPKMELTIPLARRIDLSINVQRRSVRTVGGRTRHGFGDASISTKFYLLAPEDSSSGLAIGVEPEVTLPTGNARAGLGAGKAEFILPVIAARTFGSLQLGAEISYSHLIGAGDQTVAAAMLGMLRVAPSLRLGAELVAQSPGLTVRDRATGANVGFKWDLSDTMQAYGLLGHSLERPLGDKEERFKLGMRMNF